MEQTQEQPPVERTPIPEMTYKPVQGDIGAWDYQTLFSNGQTYTPMQFDANALMKFYYQQQAQQGQMPITAQQQFINELQNYGRI